MSELTEDQARVSEIDLMRGRVNSLARQHGLNADQRIGVCLALKELDTRLAEQRAWIAQKGRSHE